MDLTLKHGWLAELAGLKELQQFFMVSDFWSKMGQDEVEFMHVNWPRLERITFEDSFVADKAAIEQQSHWQWLKVQRPKLIFDYDSMFSSTFGVSNNIFNKRKPCIIEVYF
ncbi:hypothetical protein BGX27_000674 [Mortierella sp. AM989]|nr:hypothetical protein BGX27_000674 [Mortierella sp. AM989]